jgi:hypothetical protein
MNKTTTWRHALAAILLTVHFPVQAQDTDDPRFKAVQDYLLQGDDYPELFDDKPYRMKVTGLAIGDLDGDGQAEVVLSFKPHYRQSPSIIIFRVDKDMRVTRVVEGLAPGPLVPVSGDYLDSHTLGEAVDLEFQTKGKVKSGAQARKDFINTALKNFGGVVAYKNWFHVDRRSGRKMLIDMGQAKVPHEKHNCEGFEFSTVDTIEIATKKDESGNYLLALVGDKFYAYKIHKFLDNGLMDKSLEVFSVPQKADGE